MELFGRAPISIDGIPHTAGKEIRQYSARRRQIGTAVPLGFRVTSQYDPNGNRSLRLDARGWPTSYSHDALDREVGRLFLSGERETWGFDAAGERTLMGDVTGNSEYQFDAVGRESVVITPTGHRLSHAFDANGNRSSTDGPTGA